MTPLLSILILSIPDRARTGIPVFNELCRQADELGGQVEVLCYLDNKSITVGDKWNALVESSRGEYIACIGDDDRVEPDFCSSIIEAIEYDPTVDVVCFDTTYYVDGKFVATVYWGIGYRWQDKWDEGILWRPPFERMAIRSKHKRACPYPSTWTGGDQVQMLLLQPLLKRQTGIERVLEHHMYSSKDKPCLSHS